MTGTGLALGSQSPHYVGFFLALIASGLGVAAFPPEAARQIHRVAGPGRSTEMSVFAFGGGLGFALAPLVTTALVVGLGRVGMLAVLLPRTASSCPMQQHAPPMLAAKCSAPCSEEGAMSRVGKKPVTPVKGTSATISGQTIEVKGPKGTRSFTAGDDVTLTIHAGETLSTRLPPGSSDVRLALPGGETVKLETNPDGTVSFGPISNTGMCTVQWQGQATPIDQPDGAMLAVHDD